MENLAGRDIYGNVINRKYSKFPDRKKKIGSKIFFHHGENLFWKKKSKKFSDIFFFEKFSPKKSYQKISTKNFPIKKISTKNQNFQKSQIFKIFENFKIFKIFIFLSIKFSYSWSPPLKHLKISWLLFHTQANNSVGALPASPAVGRSSLTNGKTLPSGVFKNSPCLQWFDSFKIVRIEKHFWVWPRGRL